MLKLRETPDMPLLKSNIITYVDHAPESDIRAALILEMAEKYGLTHEGKMIPGVTATVSFDGRRGSKDARYTVTLERDPTKSGQPRIAPAVQP
jgi:hypothetical protein